MRLTYIAAALICTPLTVFGQNVAETVQIGENNQQTTVQSGYNTAVTGQFGSGNSASIMQSGKHNVAAVTQIGDSHQRTVVQSGNYDGYGSVQINKKTFTRSFSGTGGNAFTSTTLVFESTQ